MGEVADGRGDARRDPAESDERWAFVRSGRRPYAGGMSLPTGRRDRGPSSPDGRGSQGRAPAPGPGGAADGTGPAATGFPRVLALIVLAGGAVRVLYDLVVVRSEPRGLDAIAYKLMASSLWNGTGYVRAHTLFTGERSPTASFAPGYVAYQALWGGIVGWGETANRMAGLLPGLLTVVLTAAIATRLLGRRAGWLAAGVVALDPTLIAVDGSAMAESISVPLVTAALWLTVRMLDEGPSWPSAIGLGAVCGAAVLTRPDLVLLVPLLAVPVALLGDAPGRPRRILLMAVVVATAVATVVPWSLRNQQVLGTYAIATLSPTSAVAGSNCDQSYGGRGIGAYDFACVEARRLEGAGEAAQAAHYQDESADYARSHLDRVPLVLVARELRVWGVWDPRDQIDREIGESRSRPWQRMAWPVRLATVVVGGAGLALLVRERWRRAIVLLAPVAVATASAALSYGNPRFASIAQPVLAVGLAFLADRWWRRRAAAGPVCGEDVPVVSTA